MGKIQKNPVTAADVALLMTVFGDLVPDGRQVTHEQIEAALKMNRATGRYRTVTDRWRRVLFRERRVWLDGRAAEGRGFIAMTPDDMVRFGASREVRSAGRKFKKALALLSAPKDEELSDAVRRQRQLFLAATEKIVRENRSALRDVSKALGPAKQLPRAAG